MAVKGTNEVGMRSSFVREELLCFFILSNLTFYSTKTILERYIESREGVPGKSL